MSEAGLEGIKRLTSTGISAITSFALAGLVIKTFKKFTDIDFKIPKRYK